MKLTGTFIAVCFAFVATLSPLHAGAPSAAKGSDKFIQPQETGVPGLVTLGVRFSSKLTDGYVDLLLRVWATENHMLAFSARAQHADNDQDVYSFGAVWRYLVPDRDIILGANIFYDDLESRNGNHFNQLGFGAEILTKWIDARANYYLPDNSRYPLATRTTRSTDTSSRTFIQNNTLLRETTTTTVTRRFTQYEEGLQGFYGEVGFLVPGLDKYFEMRLFGGYYHYDNSFGGDFEGFQARAEARILPGVIIDAAYFNDQYFNGGNWAVGARVSVPFEIGNLFRGRNPFEGAGEAFRPGKREFRDRMGEMVQRSPRIKTITSGYIPKDRDEDKKTNTVPLGPSNVSNPGPSPSPTPTGLSGR